MFLAQSFKKVLKQTFQEQKDTKNEDDLFRWMEDIERGCGLDPDDTSIDPAFKNLEGNAWHFSLGDD